MYIMLCGYPPFNGNNDTEILARVSKGTFTFPDEEWRHVSIGAKDLLQKLMTFKVKDRISSH
jgi:calcium-dependent protein kinase